MAAKTIELGEATTQKEERVAVMDIFPKEEDEDEDLQGYVDFPNERRKNGLSRLLEVFPGTYYTQYGFVKNGVIFLVRTFLDFSIFYIALFEFLIIIEISIVIQIILKVRIL